MIFAWLATKNLAGHAMSSVAKPHVIRTSCDKVSADTIVGVLTQLHKPISLKCRRIWVYVRVPMLSA